MSPFIEDLTPQWAATPRSFIQEAGWFPGRSRNQIAQWLLVVEPRSIGSRMTATIAALASEEVVRVIDAGDQFERRLAAQLLGGEKYVAERIRLQRPSQPGRACIEFLVMLTKEASTPVPLVVLDMLRPFYDPAQPLERRQELLQRAFENLQRLQISTSGVVSLCPPRSAYPPARQLFAQAEALAHKSFDREIRIPAWELRRMI
jgi:hypothetical protein